MHMYTHHTHHYAMTKTYTHTHTHTHPHTNTHTHTHTHRLTGYSPFQGETHQETFLNVSRCDYDFDDELFDVVSQEAKDFIEKLLITLPR